MTQNEQRELKRVFTFLAGFAAKHRLRVALQPALERRARLEAHLRTPDAVRLAGGGETALTPALIEPELRALAAEIAALRGRIDAVDARPPDGGRDARRISARALQMALAHLGKRAVRVRGRGAARRGAARHATSMRTHTRARARSPARRHLAAACLTRAPPPPQKEVEDMIWEVDENLDRCVDFEEFALMFRRNIADTTGLEPSQLFHVAQFCMYDRDFSGQVSVDEALHMLYARHGKERLEAEMKVRARARTRPTGACAAVREFACRNFPLPTSRAHLRRRCSATR